MIPQVDICMTAALRPTVLERTLQSIRQNLIWKGEFQLIVDIAPVGEVCYSPVYLASIVKKYFPISWIRSLPDSPQAAALKWTWERAETPYVLQWEDDWVLEKPVDLQSVIDEMPIDVGIMCFDRIGKSALDYPGYINHFEPYTPHTLRRIKGKSLGGPPSLMRHAYIRQALQIIDGTKCLDLLSHDERVIRLLNVWQVAVYLGADNTGNLVHDIGKAWKNEHKIIMKKNTSRGVTWIKK